MHLTALNKIGLVLAFVLGVIDIPAPLLFTSPDGETGPPMGIMVLCTVCGIVTVIAVVMAWRTSNGAAIRTAAGARIISSLTLLPIFFVDIDAGMRILAAVGIAITVTAVVLMLSPARRTVTVD